MTTYGIWRCSTDLQDQERQLVALQKAGAEKIYGDFITGVGDFTISILPDSIFPFLLSENNK